MAAGEASRNCSAEAATASHAPAPVLLAASGFSVGPADTLLRDPFPFALEYGAEGQRCCSILCSQAGAVTLTNFHAAPDTARNRTHTSAKQTTSKLVAPPVGASVARKAKGERP